MKKQTTIKTSRIIAFIYTAIFLQSCWSIETNDPEEVFQYWLDGAPTKGIELIEGKYYQSPHFTLEYELFLKFKTDKEWFSAFIETNGLVIDTIGNKWSSTVNLPEWFIPDSNFIIYADEPDEVFNRSRYFINPRTGICYVYETIGM